MSGRNREMGVWDRGRYRVRKSGRRGRDRVRGERQSERKVNK